MRPLQDVRDTEISWWRLHDGQVFKNKVILFDHSHELTPKEKEIWMLFDRVDVAELLARDAFAKGAYMLGAEDREIMLK